MQDTQALPVGLRRRWWGVAAAFGGAFAGTYLLLHIFAAPTAPWTWALPSGLMLAYLLGFARVNLRHNRRRTGAPILSQLGVSNGLTLTRGLSYGLLAGFIAHPPTDGFWTVVPGALYTGAALTDVADGYLARAREETTRLGAKLDVEVDSIGILVATVLAVQLGKLPGLFLGLAGLYYVFRIAIWWRAYRGLPVFELPNSPWRRLIGSFQVGFLCVILWPVLPDPITTLGGYILAGPIVLSFSRDWLAVTHETPTLFSQTLSRLRPFVVNTVPVILRGILVSAGLGLIGIFGWEGAYWVQLVGLLGTISLVLGWFGRIGAVVWLGLGCYMATQAGLMWLSGIVLASSLMLMMLGAGSFAFRSPVDRLLMQRLGTN